MHAKDRDISEFLSELKELSEKHKILIGGCGCCGSPYLYPLGERPTEKAIFADNLQFDKTDGEYTANLITDEGSETNNDSC